MSPLRRYDWTIVFIGLALSVGILYYGAWVFLIQRANTTLQREQQVALASDQYQRALRLTPPGVASIPGLRAPLREALLKQAQILFLQQKSDEALRLFQALPSQYAFLANEPDYHLWYGNALFQRGIFQEDPQRLSSDLQGAVREYQTALQLEPASWDARFNYEFLKQALLDEGEAGHLRLQLLMEEKRRDEKRQDTLPPEKVG